MQPPCKAGDEIELVEMGKDPNPIAPGTKGTVTWVNMLGFFGDYQIAVKWESGRRLMLVPGDTFKILRSA